ncbi:hypothetical protein PUN28_013434 [Cardiocondyla obscurior]|uniref:Uncharacterized protein n=1 Tax=Cardiocondyla obscurior TaxID=286306 RepID=A0AAW2F6G8_9HYME
MRKKLSRAQGDVSSRAPFLIANRCVILAERCGCVRRVYNSDVPLLFATFLADEGCGEEVRCTRSRAAERQARDGLAEDKAPFCTRLAKSSLVCLRSKYKASLKRSITGEVFIFHTREILRKPRCAKKVDGS